MARFRIADRVLALGDDAVETGRELGGPDPDILLPSFASTSVGTSLRAIVLAVFYTPRV